jgi:hypothetical protein
LHAFGSWYAYCMSNCVPRNILLRYAQPMPAFCRADSLEDDGETDTLLAGWPEGARQRAAGESRQAGALALSRSARRSLGSIFVEVAPGLRWQRLWTELRGRVSSCHIASPAYTRCTRASRGHALRTSSNLNIASLQRWSAPSVLASAPPIHSS